MSAFYAQLHLHTAESSACGRSPAADMIRACAQAGYSLVVVTDHFMNANINCPSHAPWAEKVDCLMRGYRAAKAEGDRLGIHVLFGWETLTGGPEILTYGLGEDYLLKHPDIAEWDLDYYTQKVRADGAFIVHAHPFRRAYYIEPFTPRPELYDGFEVFNAHNVDHSWDRKAFEVAKRSDLIMTSGSDAHSAADVSGGAMALPWPVHDMAGLIGALRSGRCEVFEHLQLQGV